MGHPLDRGVQPVYQSLNLSGDERVKFSLCDLELSMHLTYPICHIQHGRSTIVAIMAAKEAPVQGGVARAEIVRRAQRKERKTAGMQVPVGEKCGRRI